MRNGGSDEESTPRGYEGEEDLRLLRDFLSRMSAGNPPQRYWHPGDLTWTLFQNTRFDPSVNVGIWEDHRGIAGFALLEDPDETVTQVRPDRRGELEVEMLRWGARTARVRTSIHTPVLESDHRTLSLLEGLGFVRGAGYALQMKRGLDNLAPLCGPEGWTVRPVGGEVEWPSRVELHREVWSPSRVTLEAYERLRAAPGYDASLDLVAVGPDGEFGSYCICWYDPLSRTGLFEPVGTRAESRRLGLGRAAVEEGLGRLADLGARSAFVTCVSGNDPALALYESAGFEVAEVEHTYVGEASDLPLDVSTGS